MKNRNGFSLIEILGVITILGIVSLIGAVILALIENPLENLWEDFKYWLDCKKWDKEHKRSNKK